MPPPKGTPNILEGPGDYTTTRQVHSDTYPAIDPIKADLSGKAVFISGASRGLGKATAISFARAGASFIAISARSDLCAVEAELKAAAAGCGRKEPQTLRLRCDVADADSVEDAAARIEREFGRLDVVVNNAATIGTMQPITESDPDDWWQTSETVSLSAVHRLPLTCHSECQCPRSLPCHESVHPAAPQRPAQNAHQHRQRRGAPHRSRPEPLSNIQISPRPPDRVRCQRKRRGRTRRLLGSSRQRAD